MLHINRDTVGRLSSLQSGWDAYGPPDTTYLSDTAYNVAGQATGLTLGNGVKEIYGYDNNRLQMTSQEAKLDATWLMNLSYDHQAQAGQSGAGTQAGNTGDLMSISGTIQGQTESASYTYDLQGRLTTSSQTTNGVTANRRFDYDRWGNRTVVWDGVSGGTKIQAISLQQANGAPTNRLTSATTGGSTASYTYDAAGNVINDGVHTYQYDAENRVVSVDNGATAIYEYDHNNRRVKKSVGVSGVHYVWEGSQVTAEHDAVTGGVIAEYIYSGSRMIAKVQSGTRRYYLSDRLSARLVLDNAGAIVGRQSHLPYGEEIAASGESEKHRFTSYERDSESGLDYAINRGYASSVGRFIQADPYRASGYLVDPQSWNRFSYTRNNHVNKIDPLGLDDIDIGDFEADPVSGGFGNVNPLVPDFSQGPPVIRDPIGPFNPPGTPPGGGGQIPTEDPEPAPLPSITTIGDLRKYWKDIRDRILSKPECKNKLDKYMKNAEALIKSDKLKIFDARSEAVLNSRTYTGELVRDKLAGDPIAHTSYLFQQNRRRTLISAHIYLDAEFYTSTSDWQAYTLMHEVLHGLLRMDDTALRAELQTGSKDVSDWIKDGCK